MTTYKRCQNCHELFTEPRCPRCSRKYALERQRRNGKLKLYSSQRWINCRKNVIQHYLGYDIWMLGIGKIVRCRKPVVHHIVEREEAPDLLYRLDNLITCTADSHAEIHKMYDRDKSAALKRIRTGILKFEELYGND